MHAQTAWFTETTIVLTIIKITENKNQKVTGNNNPIVQKDVITEERIITEETDLGTETAGVREDIKKKHP